MTTLALLMDPIATIKPQKDSSLAIALAAQARSWTLHYLEMDDLYLHNGQACARLRGLVVRDNNDDWFSLSEPQDQPLAELDVVLMRKNSPINTEYRYATQMLTLAEVQGTLVMNRTQALREANEKLASTWFPQCAPPTLVTREQTCLRAFLAEHNDIIISPTCIRELDTRYGLDIGGQLTGCH